MEGLGACVPEGCSDPLLRVEAQVFLVVNDSSALDFEDMAYGGNVVNERHQAKSIPADTGDPVVFRGSTTGPSYTQSTCSPAQVTWSVRPMCAKLDINSLHAWTKKGNVFNEKESHGVRQLVTAPGASCRDSLIYSSECWVGSPGRKAPGPNHPLVRQFQFVRRNRERTVSMVSASLAFLSFRYRFTRANRSAMPPGY